tara:strand:- start:3405 stop:4277 length:873 start_codon:yes stop_codon:yes gene_type:complete
MGFITYLGREILSWRKINLSQGGRRVDIDWLLDIGGGLCWSDLQKIVLYPQKHFEMEKSLDELGDIWNSHIKTGKPLQHLIGKCPWRDFILEVNSDVLIPRQETELLVDLALSKFKNSCEGVWADLGTGSGAIAIALSKSFPSWDGHAVDCSKGALNLAKKNFNNLCPASKVSFYLGDWLDPLSELKNSFNLIIANPPYIPRVLLNQLPPMVKDFEPILALCGGEDGLESCRKLVSGAFESLCSGGWLIFEHHHDQSERALKLLIENDYENVSFANDLEGIKRFAMGSHP